jgi:hypothetical protein
MTTTDTEPSRFAGLLTLTTLLQVATAIGLAIDARIHFKLASTYDLIRTDTISQGDLFRVEGVLAVLAAVAVLVLRRPLAAVVAVAVAGGGLVPLFAYRYFDVGVIGPVPNMYEPAWFPDKTDTAIAQGVATVTGLLLLGIFLVRAQSGSRTAAKH